jgi:hypothetical protein
MNMGMHWCLSTLQKKGRVRAQRFIQKSTVATAITIGTTSGGVKLQAGDSISFNSISQKYGPTQYDLASFYAVSNAVSSVSINIMALVKKSQATNPPS